MKFKYETRRLSLKLLKPSAKYARQALDFYNRNRAVFERYEALRPKDFYTEGYQKAMLEHDYNLAIHSKCFRFWVFTKNDPARIIGSICFYDIIQPVYGHAELPAVSEPFELKAEENGVVSVIVRRLKERGKDPKTASQEDCWELFRFSFEVKPGEKCSGSFTLGEKGEITAAVTTEDGKTLTQSSFDISAERSRK